MFNNQGLETIDISVFLEEVKCFLPEGEMSEMELIISKQMFHQGEEPKMIVRELISLGCCRF